MELSVTKEERNILQKALKIIAQKKQNKKRQLSLNG